MKINDKDSAYSQNIYITKIQNKYYTRYVSAVTSENGSAEVAQTIFVRLPNPTLIFNLVSHSVCVGE